MKNEPINTQISEFIKVIQSCHINILIGSGASMPFLSTLDNIENNISFVEEHRGNLSKNTDLIKCSIYNEYLIKCIFGNLFFLLDNVDAYIQKCEEAHKGIADKFIEVRDNYNTFISNLMKIISARDIQLLSKQINIFTTNVDVFIDNSLEKLKYSYNDGFSGKKEIVFNTTNFNNIPYKISSYYEFKSEQPHINLFKIHGSVNWEKGHDISLSEYSINADYNLNNLNAIYKFYKDNEAKFIDYISINQACKVSDIKKLNELIGDLSITDEFQKLYDKIVMINPTKQKFRDTTTNVHYYEMLRIYSNHLERPNSVLFILGFSFADEHIYKITQRVAKSNPSLLIYILSAKQEVRSFKNKFIGYPNVKVLPSINEYYTLKDFNEQLHNVIEELPKSNNNG